MRYEPPAQNWTGFRKAVRERFEEQCAICGRHSEMWEMNFDAYPILAPEQGGTKRMTNYVWLCEEHASQLHGHGEPIGGPA